MNDLFLVERNSLKSKYQYKRHKNITKNTMRIVTLALAEYMAYKSGMFHQDDGLMIALISHALILPFIWMIPEIFGVFLLIVYTSFSTGKVNPVLVYLVVALSFVVGSLKSLLIINKVFKVKTKNAIRVGEYTGSLMDNNLSDLYNIFIAMEKEYKKGYGPVVTAVLIKYILYGYIQISYEEDGDIFLNLIDTPDTNDLYEIIVLSNVGIEPTSISDIVYNIEQDEKGFKYNDKGSNHYLQLPYISAGIKGEYKPLAEKIQGSVNYINNIRQYPNINMELITDYIIQSILFKLDGSKKGYLISLLDEDISKDIQNTYITIERAYRG